MIEKKSMMAIAINKSLCKEYSTPNPRTVYLNNGEEFQIQLFNPHKFTIAAKIYIDNEPLSNRLVLNPGERVWLERYLDNARKFKFSTYTVDGSDSDVQEAIKDNGVIKVEFYKEQRAKNINTYTNILLDSSYRNTSNSSGGYWYNSYGDNGNLSSQISSYVKDYSIDSKDGTITLSNNITTPELTTACYCTSASADINNVDICPSSASANAMILETGRIEEGSHSEQEFDTVYKDFSYFPFVTEKVKLLPMSQKPYTSGDLQKIYCTECGRKLNTKYKFCPYCGTKID